MVLPKISRHHGWNERLKKLQNEIFKPGGGEFLEVVGLKTLFSVGRASRAGRRENGKSLATKPQVTFPSNVVFNWTTFEQMCRAPHGDGPLTTFSLIAWNPSRRRRTTRRRWPTESYDGCIGIHRETDPKRCHGNVFLL